MEECLLDQEKVGKRENMGVIMKRIMKVSTKKFIKFLKQHKFRIWSKEGSHITLVQDQTSRQLTIPERRELGRLTVERALELANIPLQTFYAAFCGKGIARVKVAM